MIARLFLLGIRWPLQVGSILVLLTLLAAAGLPRLEMDTSFDSLIPGNDPARQVYQRVMEEFGSDNRTIIHVADPDLWSPGKLARLQNLVRGLSALPEVRDVDSLFDLRVIRSEDGAVTSRPVLEGVPESLDEALQARQRALDNPLYLGNFFSEDGSVTAIIVSVRDEQDREGFGEDVHRGIESVLEQEREAFASLFQVGPPRIGHELRTALVDDFVLLGPLSALVLIGAILFFMRSWLAALVPLVTSAVTIVWTFGLLGWTGVPLNLLSAMIPSLIIVIGSTEDTHMMAAFVRGLRENAESARREAVAHVARHVGLPLVLTVITTGLGFASNLFSRIDLIQDTRRINQDLAGVKVFFITLESEQTGAFLEPRNLRRLDRIQQFLDRQEVFDTSISVADHLKYVNRQFRGDFAELALPESPELVAPYRTPSVCVCRRAIVAEAGT